MRPVILYIDDEEQSIVPLVQELHHSLGDRYDIELLHSDQIPELLKLLQAASLELPLVIMGQLRRGLTPDQVMAEIYQSFSRALPISLTGIQQDSSELNPIGEQEPETLDRTWNATELLPILEEALKRYEHHTTSQGQSDALQTDPPRNKNHALLQATLDATVDGILALDCDGQITHFNQALINLFAPTAWTNARLGRNQDDPTSLRLRNNRQQIIPLITQWLKSSPELWEQLMAKRFSQAQGNPNSSSLTETAVAQAIAEAQGRCKPYVTSITLENGRCLEYQSQLQRVGNQIVGQVWSFHDVTERQRNETLIRYQAHHDFLTGIANRFKFNDVLEEMLTQAAENQTELAVLFIDLDRFKVINDSLGHSIGDELLKHFVQRLQRIRRPGELMARWGGDEFTMVVGNLAETDGSTQAARRILSILQRPFEVQGHQLRINVSIGIAQYPQDGTSAELLLKRADMALYEVKEEGRNGYQHYHPPIGQKGAGFICDRKRPA